jgi:hypothetical protein
MKYDSNQCNKHNNYKTFNQLTVFIHDVITLYLSTVLEEIYHPVSQNLNLF